jgi:cation transport regulator ChaB
MPKNVLPEAARVLPKAGQAVWMTAFNEALDRGLPEDEASKMAWAAVKRAGYTKDSSGKWSKYMNLFDTDLTLNDDGTFEIGVPLMKVNAEKRTVSGFATLDNIDQVGDQVTSDASQEAFGDWIGNIREMHQKNAVGKAIDWRKDTYTDEETGNTYEGMWVTAKISKGAEDTWQKVLDGTLAGFSIGGATLEKQRDLVKTAEGTKQIWKITKYKLTELSLVDNPCNKLATISLVKSVDGALETTDTLADGNLDKAYDGETGDFVDLSGEYKDVVRALEALRDRAVSVNADHVVSEASDKLSCFRSKARWEAQDAEYSVSKSEDSKEDTTVSTEKDLEKSDETLQVNDESGKDSVELNEEDKGLLRKLVDFIKGEEAPAGVTTEVETTETEKEGTPDMNADEVAEAITEASSELNKGVDSKFEQVGESLTKIQDLLEKVATSESVDELKKELEAKVEELAGRIEAVETSGAIKKSGEDAGKAGEEIEKSDEGFWGGNILPEFVKSR